MDAVITVIGNPANEALSPAFVESMRPSLSSLGWQVDHDVWLAEGEACDLYVAANDLRMLDQAVARIIADQPYDAIVQPAMSRRKKLLISDMDSTMITVECIDELADYVGCKAEVSAITEAAMRGELDFEAALEERVALLKDLPEEILGDCYRERITLMPGAKTLIATLKDRGVQCILVSGGFTFFTARVKQDLGMDYDYANRLEIKDGRLTGQVLKPILGQQAKLNRLHSACDDLRITPDDVIAVGDGANDLPMIKQAGMGVAYRAKPIVREQAAARVNIGDLTSLLFIQGYRKERWVEG